MTPIDVTVYVCAALLTIGAGLAIVRAEKGPSMLDRTVALDIVVTAMVAAVALYASVQRRADVVPVLVVLSLVGFVGSVTIARFASVEPEGEGRVRTREEVAAEEAERRRQEVEEEERRRRPHVPESSVETLEAEPDDEHHGGGAKGEVR
ncbi:monovalent cation/H+ antiporter complex subunit F [Cellulomonas shaoxiangyii]|uniref:pH regulation protein F n=1 Tax=Cellulomonas shaoxiangyii TaxID=2566013 RepID=A0A4P7SLM1_9CELL|nr:monovalent cation/H+ antiporter complex subunit F [Cellulomonas shaoxiangyii]QCB94841.1 pH regulation protein F [Cellulomonas shaoxiangyii]TGY86572.1 pH regulation protein F [Cellulomonas shaoxiangyii]